MHWCGRRAPWSQEFKASLDKIGRPGQFEARWLCMCSKPWTCGDIEQLWPGSWYSLLLCHLVPQAIQSGPCQRRHCAKGLSPAKGMVPKSQLSWLENLAMRRMCFFLPSLRLQQSVLLRDGTRVMRNTQRPSQDLPATSFVPEHKNNVT